MTHSLKIWPSFYAALCGGTKPFELRKADRDFKVGDALLLQEWDNESGKYTGKEWHGHITYILAGHQGLRSGYVILGIRERDSE